MSDAQWVKRQACDYLLTKSGVVACGVGFKEIGGEITDEQCVVVSVERKLAKAELASSDLVPRALGAVRTDVREVGMIRALEDQRFRCRPALGGVSISHECFDEKTRILTRTGLKFFYEMDGRSEIATLNSDTGFLEYQKPTGLFLYEHKGQMIRFRGKTVDLLVTPSHNLYFRNRYSPRDFSLATAEEVLESNAWENIQFKRDMRWRGEEGLDFFEIPSQTPHRKAFDALQGWDGSISEFARCHPVSYKTAWRWSKGICKPMVFRSPQRFVMDDWLAFLGWYLSEGSSSGRNIAISERSGRYHKEILALLQRMGVCAFVAANNSIGFAHTELSLYLKRFGTAKKKYIPQDIKNLPPRKLGILLESLMNGDGHYDGGKYRHYKSASERLATDVLEIALKCGYGATIMKRYNRGHWFEDRWIRGGDSYRVGFSHVKKTPRLGVEPELVDYEGDVYCVEVPNHIVFVERNGKTCWSGNSVSAGTLGCLVRRGGDLFILSNCHVLANSNAAKMGDPIIQPGRYDGGTLADQIAVLAEFVPLDFGGEEPDCPIADGAVRFVNWISEVLGRRHRVGAYRLTEGVNRVDAALARPLSDDLVDRMILEIGVPGGVGEATLGMAVEKSGRTTGHTRDKIVQIDVTVRVSYGNERVAVFEDQVMAGPMSQGGDSGSVVMDEGSLVVGLLFAGSDAVTLMNPIQFVLDALDVEIVV